MTASEVEGRLELIAEDLFGLKSLFDECLSHLARQLNELQAGLATQGLGESLTSNPITPRKRRPRRVWFRAGSLVYHRSPTCYEREAPSGQVQQGDIAQARREGRRRCRRCWPRAVA